MASEIRVNKIENRSGLGTVTFADTGVDLAGIVTATTFSGSGASLTDLPAGNLSGTVADARLTTVSSSKLSGALPALDGSALTGVASTENIRTNTNATFLQNVNVSGSTTTGTTIVGGGVTISESGIEASGIGITCANINGTQIGGRRNLVINGDMRVAQRGTSSTTNGYGDLDRWKHEFSTVNESPTFAQVSLTTSDTPYTLGLTKAAKITNGNQTSGLQASSLVNFNQNFEAQDLRNSGWNYKSDTSYLTLSFWVRASVAQNYHGFVKTQDGSNYSWSYETGALSANTWTKIVKKIPGNSNLTINDDTGGGFQIFPIFFAGTNYTSDSISNDTWKAWSSSERSKDQTATWFATNDATLEITGVQLEVGSQDTPFEHRSYGEELRLCQRYFYSILNQGWETAGQQGSYVALGVYLGGSKMSAYIYHPVEMRVNPTLVEGTGSNYWNFYRADGADNFNGLDGIITNSAAPHGTRFTLTEVQSNVSGTGGHAGIISIINDNAYLQFSAEL